MNEFSIKLNTKGLIEKTTKELEEKALNQCREIVHELTTPKRHYGGDGKLVVTKSYVQVMIEAEVDKFVLSEKFNDMIKVAIEQNMSAAMDNAAKRYCAHVASKAVFSSKT